jgi:Ca2+-transporting ATPase
MRRPPRPTTQRLLGLATLLGSLSQGMLVFATVAAIYLFAGSLSLPASQLGALAFTSLVMGNLGLIVINRAGGIQRRWWRQPNPAFWIVSTAATSLLALIVCFQPVGQWFGFSPPPMALLSIAAFAPLAALALVDACAALRHRR